MRTVRRPARVAALAAVVVAVATAAGAVRADAQRPVGVRAADLQPEDRVRVTLRRPGTPPRIGTFVTFAGDTLAILPNVKPAHTVVRYALDSVRALDVSVGKGACGGGRRVGCVLLGGLVGLAAVTGLEEAIMGRHSSETPGVAIIAAPVGLLAGLIVGGSVFGDRWAPVELPGRH